MTKILLVAFPLLLSFSVGALECQIDQRGSFKLVLNDKGRSVELYEEIHSATTGVRRILTHDIHLEKDGSALIELQESNQRTGGQSISIKTNPLKVAYHEDDGDAEYDTFSVNCK